MKKRANGEGSWIEREINGSKYQVFSISIEGKLKHFYGKTRKEATIKYKKYLDMSSIDSSKDIQKMTFTEYATKWLFEWRKDNLSPKTFDYYDYAIKHYLTNTELHKLQIGTINSKTPREIRIIFQNAINANKNYSRSVNNSVHTVLSQVSKYGFIMSDFVCDYMNGVEKLTERDVETKTKITKSLTYEQVMKLWEEMERKNTSEIRINGKPGTYIYGINSYALLFCCFTGLRWGELSRLEWKDILETENGTKYISINKQYVYVNNRDTDAQTSKKYITKYPKEEKTRLIPLSKQAIIILEQTKDRFPELFGPNNLIFSSTGNPISDSNARKTLKKMCAAAKVPIVSPHELRHTFASILLNEDVQNLYTVSELLGHSSPDITYRKYIDIFEKNKMDTIKLFDSINKKPEQ